MDNCNFKTLYDTPEELAYEQHSQKIINMDNKHGKCVVVRASFMWGFDAGLMHSKNEIEKLQEQNKTIREALEYYSDDGGRDKEDISSVQKCIMGMIVVIAKGGKRAREALKKAEEA